MTFPAIRRFAFNEQGQDKPVVMTEDEIRSTYWDYWVGQMTKKFGPESDRINWENCLDDFLVVNWAWEVKDDPQT